MGSGGKADMWQRARARNVIMCRMWRGEGILLVHGKRSVKADEMCKRYR